MYSLHLFPRPQAVIRMAASTTAATPRPRTQARLHRQAATLRHTARSPRPNRTIEVGAHVNIRCSLPLIGAPAQHGLFYWSLSCSCSNTPTFPSYRHLLTALLALSVLHWPSPDDPHRNVYMYGC
jgi:hypothetical protein